MTAIYKKEVRSYLCSMIGCVMIALILAFIGFFTVYANITTGIPNFEYALIMAVSFYVFIITIPFITMKSIADERHSKTEQLLLSLPIPTYKIVLAKFFAMLTIVGIPLLISGVYPILLTLFSSTDGAVNFATTYSGWFMLLLMLAAMTAMGMFASSIVESQIIAAVISAGMFLLLFFVRFFAAAFPSGALASLIAFMLLAAALGAIVLLMTKNSTAACIATGVPAVIMLILYVVDAGMFAGLFPTVLSAFAFFDKFMYGGALLGVFDVGAAVYYISFTAVFVFLTVESIERRRYS